MTLTIVYAVKQFYDCWLVSHILPDIKAFCEYTFW